MKRELTKFTLLENRAGQLLQQFGERANINVQPPIKIEDIANFLGYRCLTGNLDNLVNGAAGALLKEERIILVNKNESYQRQRFSIAHEIGHIVLSGFDDVDDRLYYSDVAKKHPEKKLYLEEVACDKLAGALLIPYPLLNKQFGNYSIINEITIYQLAKTFNVSARAMLSRIEYLVYYLTQISNIDWNSIEKLKRHLLTKGQKIASSPSSSIPNATDVIYFTEDPPIIQLMNNKLLQLGCVKVAFRNGKKFEFAKTPLEIDGKPLVIEFSGTPNGGKDTQIQILADYLRDYRGYRVNVINELYDSSRGYPGSSDKLLWMVGMTIKNLIEIKNDKKFDVILINRGLFDILTMLEMYYQQGHINKKELVSFSASLSSKKLCDIEDIVILIKTTPEISLQREKIYPRNSVVGLAEKLDQWDHKPKPALTNPDGLVKINDCYDKVLEKHNKNFKDFCFLNDYGDITMDDAAIAIGTHIQPLFPEDIFAFHKESFLQKQKTIEKADQLSFTDF